MNVTVRIFIIAFLCIPVFGEVRTWTLKSGQTFEGEFVKVVIDKVLLIDVDGNEIKVPKKQLSAEDESYIQLHNPPELSVDKLEGFRQDNPTPSMIWEDRSLVTALYYNFGARVKLKGISKYDHELTVVAYELTKQVYDPSKYHIIAKIESEPFKLTKANDFRYEFRDMTERRVLRWVLGGTYPRGEKMAERIVLVYDKRGVIIAYNTSKKWLYNNLDKLESLPVGAWIDDKCNRVHPTSPKRNT